MKQLLTMLIILIGGILVMNAISNSTPAPVDESGMIKEVVWFVDDLKNYNGAELYDKTVAYEDTLSRTEGTAKNEDTVKIIKMARYYCQAIRAYLKQPNEDNASYIQYTLREFNKLL